MTWKRFWTTLATIGAAIGALAFARGKWMPQTHWAIEDYESFWLLKIYQPPLFDMLLLGDSRILNAASPSAVAQTLSYPRVLNFGFSQVAFNQAYLDASREKLDPVSDRRALVLGVSPYSLTTKSDEENPFLQMHSKSRSEFLLLEALQGIRPYFDQVLDSPLDEYWRHFSRIEPGNLDREFYRDGWNPVIMVTPTRGDSREAYQNMFQGSKVSPRLVRDLMETIRRWRAEGIRVFGYRAPTAEEVKALEREMLGFAEDAFAAQFREAGGTWLSLPGDYELFDGDHMDKESAIRFSRRLAGAIRDEWR